MAAAPVAEHRYVDRRALRLHVLSDVHLEREGARLPPPARCDAVLLAGDIGNGADGVRAAAAWSPDRPVVYVGGNHEPYGRGLPDLTDELRAAAPGHVHVLEDDEVVLGGVRVLGCTLWSDFRVAGAEQRDDAMALAERIVNDYKRITWTPEGRPLRAADTVALHERSRAWLAARLATPFDGPTVVVTHHAPLTPPDPPRTRIRRAIAGAFCSDLRDLMGGDRVALWVFGHTHLHADVDVDGTRVLSNPRGYPEQDVAGYDPALLVDV